MAAKRIYNIKNIFCVLTNSFFYYIIIIAMIIAGFPCIGKTTMAKNFDNVMDLSSTKFHYIIKDEEISEQLKGNEDNLIVNPQWPQNYIDELLKIRDNYDIIFILARDYILEKLNNLKIEYVIAIPEEGLKEEYILRAKARGNNEDFIRGFDLRYDKWRNMMISQPVKKLYLKKGEFIETALKRLNYLEEK